MAEDWRLKVEFDEETVARTLTARLEARDLQHNLRTAFHDRVVVSRDGPVVFCYANSGEQIEAVAHALDALSAKHAWTIRTEVERWHSTAERWEPPEKPLPATPSERREEHHELIEREREESKEQGFPLYEVRIKCESRHEAEDLARRLGSEGIPTVHRWQFVVAGADDEDTARGLAERIRKEAPAGATVLAEGSVQEIAQDAPFATPFTPFSVFGGLGG